MRWREREREREDSHFSLESASCLLNRNQCLKSVSAAILCPAVCTTTSEAMNMARMCGTSIKYVMSQVYLLFSW